MPSVDDPHHKRLESDVADYLHQAGCFVFSLTYHDHCDPETIKALSRQFNPTALYIRGRSDRIACDGKSNVSFEWEAKTSTGTRRSAAIELLPFLHHLAKAELYVQCLYVYRNSIVGQDAGWWMRDPPVVQRVMFPQAQRWGDTEWLQKACAHLLPNTTIVRGGSSAGSGDPFLIIAGDVIDALPDWRKLIDDRLECP